MVEDGISLGNSDRQKGTEYIYSESKIADLARVDTKRDTLEEEIGKTFAKIADGYIELAKRLDSNCLETQPARSQFERQTKKGKLSLADGSTRFIYMRMDKEKDGPESYFTYLWIKVCREDEDRNDAPLPGIEYNYHPHTNGPGKNWESINEFYFYEGGQRNDQNQEFTLRQEVALVGRSEYHVGEVTLQADWESKHRPLYSYSSKPMPPKVDVLTFAAQELEKLQGATVIQPETPFFSTPYKSPFVSLNPEPMPELPRTSFLRRHMPFRGKS
jgi:hypothetical protein